MRASILCQYGAHEARAFYQSNGRLSVSLLKDPGTGSMFFHNIFPGAVRVTEGDPVLIRRVAADLREAAKYLTAGSPVIGRHTAEADRLERLADRLDFSLVNGLRADLHDPDCAGMDEDGNWLGACDCLDDSDPDRTTDLSGDPAGFDPDRTTNLDGSVSA